MRHPSDQHRRRWSKNLALLIVLAGLVALFYVVTLVRMGGSEG
jgi:hypothetical protein